MKKETCNITATKVFNFSAAHMLSGHEGDCKNLHGHNYLLEVTACHDNGLSCNTADDGMVIDFSELKEIVNKLIINKIDHAFIYNEDTDDEFEKRLFNLLESFGKKVVVFPSRPTAENMGNYFITLLNDYLVDYGSYITITNIKLWETGTSYAEVFWGGM